MERRPSEQELREMLAGIQPGESGMLPPPEQLPGMQPHGAWPGGREIAGDIPPEIRTPEPPPAQQPKRKKERKTTKDEDGIISRCYELFEEFRSAYVSEWERQDRNEKLYRCEHWEEMRTGDVEDPIEPVTPLVQSIVENVKADLMDGFPHAEIRPESPEDNDLADVVGKIIEQNHDAQNFRDEYILMCHDLLNQGWCAAEAGFDSHAYNNIGMAFIRHVNIRNILFDPEVEDIQDGRAVFKFERVTIKRLEEMYPQYEGEFVSDVYDLMEERDAQVQKDPTKDLLLIEYWWREYDTAIEGYRVHMVKVAGHKLLEDSRREKPDGYFSMGIYPFAVTTMLRRKGSPLGLGFADSFGIVQRIADKMDQIIVKNTIMASKNKMMVQRSSGFDVDDLQDWEKEVHVGDNIGGVTWMQTPPLPTHILGYVQQLRQTARDESGANDFSRGNTASGVTAASAIAALQEASGKRSRMAKDKLHGSYKELVRMEIEFEREYNLLPRHVLLVRNGEEIPMTFESEMMTRISATGVQVPIEFFISIKVETQRQWQVQTHNELMLQLLQLGALTPEQAVGGMVFEGRETILKQMAETRKAQEQAAAAAMQQGGPAQDPAAEQAAQAQAQAEETVRNLPDPKALAQAGGAKQSSIVMGQ